MRSHRIALTTMLGLAFLPVAAIAQESPPPPAPPGAGSPVSAADRALISDPYKPPYGAYSSGHQYRSRTASHPHYSEPDDTYGFRNPGGVGRMNEFYPPGNQFPNQGQGRNPVVAAQFGTGSPDLSRSMQMQAQSIGIQRTNSLNQQIDALARPMGGYGFGFGFGGFPY